FMRYANVPAPHSIYQGIRKLGAGMILTVTHPDLDARVIPEPTSYWSVSDAYRRVRGAGDNFSDEHAIEALQATMERAVGDMSLADVPLGAFLSGGIDSSLVVALMQKQHGRPVKTFTIGFEDAEYNEAGYARKVARHLGTEHTELTLGKSDILDAVPKMATTFAEPFADSSQLPTYLVSKMARNHVTVSLSGDAGDELFYGYDRYHVADRLLPRLEKLPRPLRIAASRGIQAIPVTAWDSLLRRTAKESARKHISGDRIHKLGEMIAYSGEDGLYQHLMTHWNAAETVVLGSTKYLGVYDENVDRSMDRHDRYMTKDLRGYLPDDILTKVDRAAMAVSLETRVPM